MKKLLGVVIFTILAIFTLASFAATLTSMSKADIEKAFINKTFPTMGIANLNDESIKNTFTGFFDDKGNAMGKFSNKPVNGPQTDKGTYSIQDDGTLHITWQHWDSGKQLCLHVFDTQNVYLIVSCDNVFHTAFLKKSIQSGNHLK